MPCNTLVFVQGGQQNLGADLTFKSVRFRRIFEWRMNDAVPSCRLQHFSHTAFCFKYDQRRQLQQRAVLKFPFESMKYEVSGGGTSTWLGCTTIGSTSPKAENKLSRADVREWCNTGSPVTNSALLPSTSKPSSLCGRTNRYVGVCDLSLKRTAKGLKPLLPSLIPFALQTTMTWC